ncbi:MAG: YdeI/OmpD-associated family protein [Mycobacteriales bacterium]
MHLRVRLGQQGQVELSHEQRAELGGGVRIPVAGTINGAAFRTTSFRMGDFTGIAFRKQIQLAAGAAPGDEVDLEIERDTAPRLVEVPAELAKALADDATARAAFDGMSFTHRREYAEWIAGARKDETRERRLAKALTMLRAGQPLG